MPAIPVLTCDAPMCAEPVAVMKHRLCAAHYAGLRRSGRIPTAPYGRTIAPRSCLKCGATFQPVRASHRYCGPLCQNAAGHARRYQQRLERDAAEASTAVAPDPLNINRSPHAR